MGTTRATWHRATRLNLTWSFASALLVSFGCNGGLIDNPGADVGGNSGLSAGGTGTGGATSVACYSPTQNLSTAYQVGAQGCACDPTEDEAVCVQGVALVCTGNTWDAVMDGPCMPTPGTGGSGNLGIGGNGGGGNVGNAGATSVACYSPTQNLSTAYQTGAKGCGCNPTTDEAVCVQGVALMCIGDTWKAVIDGPCMPRPSTGGSSSFGGSTNAGNGGGGNVGNVGSVGGAGGAKSSSTCFSPTQNTQGLTPGAPNGCPCSGGSVCVNGVGLICSSGYWMAVWDGPCMPVPASGGRSSIGTGGSSAGGTTAVAKACGARAGDTCSANEYCAYEPGEYCGQADAEAVCRPRPEVCDAMYAAVCGCDGKTYGSSCEAAAAGTGVYANGTCTI